MAKFKAYKFKVTQDSEGEVKLILVVSKMEADEAINIPVGVLLDVEINQEADQ
jgi:hypothetical protein